MTQAARQTSFSCTDSRETHSIRGDLTGTGFGPTGLASNCPMLAFGPLDMKFARSKWAGHAMTLYDRAANFAEELRGHDIGVRPLVFVAHSLGGLLVKKLLQRGVTMRDVFVENVRGVVFLSTPHSGSRLANLFAGNRLLTNPTSAMRELRQHEAQLRELSEWYREQMPLLGLKTKVFFETLKTRLIAALPIPAAYVVDPTSANPGLEGVSSTPVDADHISIALPRSRSDMVYVGVRDFVRECLGETRYDFDLFVSHSRADREAFVQPLVHALEPYMRVWVRAFRASARRRSRRLTEARPGPLSFWACNT